MISMDCIWPAQAELGEAPVWCPDEEALYWVDIIGRAVHRLDPRSGERDSFPQAHQIGCIVKREGGGFIAGFDCGLGFVDDALAGLEIFAAPEAGALVAALDELRATGFLSKDDHVVLFDTGAGIKYLDCFGA